MLTRHGWKVLMVAVSLYVGPLMAAEVPVAAPKAPVELQSREVLGQGVTVAKLNSGLTIIVRENHAAPVATVRCFVVNTGSAYEAKWLGAGLSHLAEHLVAGGSTTNRTEKEISALVDTMGGQTNAYTSNDVTAYHIDCPSKQVNLAMELIADSMQHAAFVPEEYQRELGVVQRELEMGESDRDRVLYNSMKQLIYTTNPIRVPTIGYLQVLQEITRDDLIEFYRQRYAPQNMIFIVAGDVNTDKVLEETLKNFKNFRRTEESVPALPEEPAQASPRLTRIEMPGETVHLALAWPTVALQDPDLYPLDVADYLLTNGDSSRLVKRLKIDEPLASSVESFSFTPGFVKGWFQVTVECKPENVEKCRRIVIEEVARLATEPVPEKELAKVKRQKAAEHVFGQQTVEQQAESLGRSYQSTGDPLFDDQYVQGIQRVNAAQIQAAARRYFRPERENRVYIEPVGTSAERKNEGALAAAESDVIKKVLPNGLTVLVKRHAVQPLVTMQAFVKAGIISDTDATSGRAALATEMMNKGTAKFTADQIADYFDSIGGSLTVSSQRNSSFLSCSVLKDDFPTAYDYAQEVLFKPTFPAAQFEKAKQLQLMQLAARKANPQSEIMDYWSSQLPKTTPYHRTVQGTTETVGKLTVDECRKFHQQYFAPENMVLAIYGDIDPQQTLAMVESTLGKLPRSNLNWPKFPETHSADREIRAVLKTQQDGTAMVIMGYPTVSIVDEKTRDALNVLSGVLTGGSGAGGRLFDELRGARLVYYVFGMEMTGFAPGYYLFMAQTQPESADEVVKRIEQNLERIRKEGIPEKELAQVKEKLIAGHALTNTTPREQAFQAALNELYGLGYDYEKSYDERISAITSADVQEAITKFFRNPVIVTSQPE